MLIKSTLRKGADISYTDKTNIRRHVHYFTDDTVGHPLCKSHIGKEMKNLNAHATIKALEKCKEKRYSEFIQKSKKHPAVVARTRIINYITTAFTSLGEMGDGTTKIVNGCISFWKSRLIKQIREEQRADGRSAKELTAELRYDIRAQIQFAIAQGNSALAAVVGF